MMQPDTTSGAVANPNSSAPSSAPHDVAARFHLAIGLHRNPSAQTVQHQRLLGFCESQFPRRSSVLNR